MITWYSRIDAMSRKDLYHDLVVEALETSGWTVTDDPLRLTFGDTNLYVDLGAQRLLGAQKGSLKIAVEIKSFVGMSAVQDLEIAVGQYNVYRDVLSEQESDRLLYLAIPRRSYEGIFRDELGRLVARRQRLLLAVFGEQKGGLEWRPDPETAFEKSSAG